MASSGFDGQLHGDSTGPSPAPAGALSEIWRTRPDWVAGVVRYSPGKTLELWVVSGSVFRSFFGSAAAPSANWLLHCDTARGVRRGRPCIDLARRRSHGSMAHLPQLPAQARRGAHTAWRCVPWGTGSAEAPQKWTTDPPAAAVLERRRP